MKRFKSSQLKFRLMPKSRSTIVKGNLLKSKNCIECANPIPSAAIKCSECSAYQDWRRYIPFSHSTIALIVAIIALLGTFSNGGRYLVTSIGEALSNTNFSATLGISKIGEESVTFLVRNTDDSSIVFDKLSCALFLPLDRMIEKNSDEAFESRWPNRNEAVGAFWITYNIDNISLLESNQQELFTGTRYHVVPPRPGLSDSPKEAASLCTLAGVDEYNKTVATATFLRVSDLTEFDILSMISLSDYSPAQQNEKLNLIDEILTLTNSE